MRPWPVLLAACACANIAAASEYAGRDVLFLGEVHDNPAHHATQARIVTEVAPKAIVFEMLTEDQAARVTPKLVADAAALEAALEWADSGWPDFSLYYPVFAAAPQATIRGAAVPRDEARKIMEMDLADAFGKGAERFGLNRPLPDDQQTAREDLQRVAHCDALPDTLLPMMVDMQRLRDARLAAVAIDALDQTGGPVVVITGNGHARADWGAPALARLARGDSITVFSLGQGENGAAPDGSFDATQSADPPDRGDPCEAFR